MIALTLAVLLDPFRHHHGRHWHGLAPGTAAQQIRWAS